MAFPDLIKKVTPGPLWRLMRAARDRFVEKHDAELAFWQSRFDAEGGRFRNSHYEKLMLGMAQESSDEFLAGKVVADFGCGPRGSLVWAKSARLRIGIDVLADRYVEAFGEDMRSHDIIYLKSTEKVIPLPTGLVDVMFTLNAIDHVDNFGDMCDEILRVLKPGGDFIGAFNLEEPATSCEPQRLDEATIREHLLDRLEVTSYRVTLKGPKEALYSPFFSDQPLVYRQGEEGFLWVRATKPI